MYGMVSSHSGARARIKHKTFSQQSTEQAGTSARKPARNIFQRFINFVKDTWYGITENSGKSFFFL